MIQACKNLARQIKSAIKAVIRIMAITDSFDMRRYLAIMFIAGGAMAFTLLIGWIVYLISFVYVGSHPAYVFWIAIGSLALVALMLTGFVSLIAKREVQLDKEGKLIIKDLETKIERINDSK